MDRWNIGTMGFEKKRDPLAFHALAETQYSTIPLFQSSIPALTVCRRRD
jgi:hypothetical protein